MVKERKSPEDRDQPRHPKDSPISPCRVGEIALDLRVSVPRPLNLREDFPTFKHLLKESDDISHDRVLAECGSGDRWMDYPSEELQETALTKWTNCEHKWTDFHRDALDTVIEKIVTEKFDLIGMDGRLSKKDHRFVCVSPKTGSSWQKIASDFGLKQEYMKKVNPVFIQKHILPRIDAQIQKKGKTDPATKFDKIAFSQGFYFDTMGI